jgi:WXG100 family type VII secretion target
MANIKVTPEEVKELGDFCTRTSEDITQMISKIEGQLSRTTWESPAASRFRGDWGTHKTNLTNMRTQLNDLGEAARKMAINYSDADAAYGKG